MSTAPQMERAGRASPYVPILMYHSISAGRAGRRFRQFVTDPGEFADQMDYLDAAGYEVMTAAELVASHLAGRQLPPRPAVLTFDDAYDDFYSTALPVLRSHAFPATLAVPTAHVGDTARWMASIGEGGRGILSWSALRDVASEGVEIASHSHTHPQLDRVAAAVSQEEAHRSQQLIEDNLSVRVTGFTYPFGYWNEAALAAVRAAGFRYACVVADLPSGPGDDVLRLPRLTVRAALGTSGLARLLAARPTLRRRQAAMARRVLSLAVRRTVPALGGDPREGSP